jgi:NADPH:quinone reductase-like Zn-dependent oxidoreductase
MRAIRIESVGKIGAADVPDPVPQAGEALVELKAAALNHRDVWIKKGQYAGLRFPCIPGSDGAGIVTTVGPGADASWVGREVVIYPGFNWGPVESAQGPDFSILGLPRDGTLADKVAVPMAQLSAKPPSMSWEEAAALPLSGLTAWRALMSRAHLGKGERVLVTGIGGGGALFALQFAVASGNEVWVTSSSDEKIGRAVKLGARGGFRYDREGWAADAAKTPGQRGRPGIREPDRRGRPWGPDRVLWRNPGQRAGAGPQEGLLEAAVHPGNDHGERLRLARHE